MKNRARWGFDLVEEILLKTVDAFIVVVWCIFYTSCTFNEVFLFFVEIKTACHVVEGDEGMYERKILLNTIFINLKQMAYVLLCMVVISLFNDSKTHYNWRWKNLWPSNMHYIIFGIV